MMEDGGVGRVKEQASGGERKFEDGQGHLGSVALAEWRATLEEGC